jgi:diaminopimelate decarboxylase
MLTASPNKALRHALSNWKCNDEGELMINGLTIGQSVSIAGGTPVYLYDRSLLRQRITALRAALPKTVSILYSLKANPNPAFVGGLANLVDGFDIASGSELGLAFNFAREGAVLQFSGPGKSRVDAERAMAAGAVLNVESVHQLDMVANIAGELQVKPRICLRVNPSFLPGGSGLRMTGRPTQFGISSEHIPDIIARSRSLSIEPMGLHFYWGTQLLDGNMIADIQQRSWQEARNWMTQLQLNIIHLNLGGGFGIPYFQNDERLDLVPISAGLTKIDREYKKQSPNGKLIIELGRYIAGEAGIYVSSVVDIKHSATETFLVIDGGMHHHLAASGNLGQGLPRSFPCVLPEKIKADTAVEVSVAGCLCTPIDMLARKVTLPQAEIGDLFAILQSGAYGASASPTGFLSHEPPREQMI